MLLAVGQIRQVNKQIHRELEAQYLHRFWELMDRTSLKFKKGESIEPDDEIVLMDYLQLCEDQIGLRKVGRVTDDTWSFWENDIRAFCNAEPLNSYFERVSDRYPGLAKLLKNSAYDPLQIKKPLRFWRGL